MRKGNVNVRLLELEIASPCIIMYSNESTNQMQEFLSFIVSGLDTTQHERFH
jgi:hypothetical protein